MADDAVIEKRVMGAEIETALYRIRIGREKILETLIPEGEGWRRVDEGRRTKIILPNQGIVYFDNNRNLEFATPECLGPDELIVHEVGIRHMARAAAERIRQTYLNSSDGTFFLADTNCERDIMSDPFKLGSRGYGSCQGSYQMPRKVEEGYLHKCLIPLFTTWWIIVGNGWFRVTDAGFVKFVLSQRAEMIDHVSAVRSNEPNKPLINLKDDPLADRTKYRRFQNVACNQNMSEYQIGLRHAIMDMVLMLIEADGFLTRLPVISDSRFNPPYPSSRDYDTTLHAQLQFFNADVFGSRAVLLSDGRRCSAVDMQKFWIEEVERYFREGRGPETDERRKWLAFWIKIVDALDRRDLDFLAQYLDWAAILKNYLMPVAELIGFNPESLFHTEDEKGEGVPHNAKVSGKKVKNPDNFIDFVRKLTIGYADVFVERSRYGRLLKDGRLKKLYADEEIKRILKIPPASTRAAPRDRAIRNAVGNGFRITAFDWSIVTVRRETEPHDSAVIGLPEPLQVCPDIIPST